MICIIHLEVSVIACIIQQRYQAEDGELMKRKVDLKICETAG
jgi:hypothetical protein